MCFVKMQYSTVMVFKVATPQQEVRVCGNHVLADFTQLGMGLAGERKHVYHGIENLTDSILWKH